MLKQIAIQSTTNQTTPSTMMARTRPGVVVGTLSLSDCIDRLPQVADGEV
jgi:hypothetical protein